MTFDEELYQKDTKLHKVKFYLNLLPVFGQHFEGGILKNSKVELMKVLKNHTSNSAVQNLVDFKWQSYGRRLHSVGFVFHLYFLGTLIYSNVMTYV